MALLNTPGIKLTPSASMTPTGENYLGIDDFDFANQYLPDTYKTVWQRFGSQDLTGMLRRLSKEMPLVSDIVLWKEEQRLRLLGEGVTRSSNVFTLSGHNFRVGETIVVRNADGSVVRQGRISANTDTTFTALCGDAAGWTAVGTSALTVFVDGNEFKKKTNGMDESLNTQFESFSQKPVIIKDYVDESGSNLAQITWLQVTVPNTGESGYVWFFANRMNTEKRLDNAIETKMVGRSKAWGGDLAADGYEGTQGLMDIASEGNVFEGQIADMADVDQLCERMDAQGAISDNYIYGTTAFNSSIDDFLKAEHITGLSWGAFDNDEKMALNLGFSGMRRSGYQFSKSRWGYLNDITGEGSMVGTNKNHALMIPSGSESFRDEVSGKSTTAPMLHLRYRAYGKENRRYKVAVRSFEQGTTGGKDIFITDYLTERCLVALGRNNLFLFKG